MDPSLDAADVLDFVANDDKIEIADKVDINDLLEIVNQSSKMKLVRTRSGAPIYDVADTVINEKGILLFVPKNVLGYGEKIEPYGKKYSFNSRLFNVANITIPKDNYVSIRTSNENIDDCLTFTLSPRAISISPNPSSAYDLLDVYIDENGNYVLDTKDRLPIMYEISTTVDPGYFVLSGIDENKGGIPAKERYFENAVLLTVARPNNVLDNVNLFARDTGDFIIMPTDSNSCSSDEVDIVVSPEGDIEIRPKEYMPDRINITKTDDGDIKIATNDGEAISDLLSPAVDENGDIIFITNNLYFPQGEKVDNLRDATKDAGFNIIPQGTDALLVKPKADFDIDDVVEAAVFDDKVSLHPVLKLSELDSLPGIIRNGGNPFVPRFVDFDINDRFDQDNAYTYRDERNTYREDVSSRAYEYLYENDIDLFDFETGEYNNAY